MIPWFVVSIVAALVRPFGRSINVTGRCGCRGVTRIHIVKRRPDLPMLRHLRTLDGEPLTPA